MARATVIVGLALLLSACQTGPGVSGQGPVVVEPAGSSVAMGGETGIKSIAPCYRTLAKVDCHSISLAAERNRRVGYFHGPSTD